MSEDKPVTNALIGALVIVFTTPIVPFAPILGGGVAGYLEGGNRSDGLLVGALAGLIAVVPLVFIILLLGNLFVLLVAGTGSTMPFLAGGLGAIAIVLVVLTLLLYVVVLSALGGWAGSYLKTETDL